MDFAQRYGPCAGIAGGSEGVGESFARRLAAQGLDLILVARREGPLAALAEDLRARHPGRRVRTLALDLTLPETPDRIAAAAADQEVGLFIHNAGAASAFGEIVEVEPRKADRLIALNITAMTHLVHAFGGPMKARGRGGIVIVGSQACVAGSPSNATYAAVKAFSTIYAEGLWGEMKPYGVHVLGYVLGAVDTPLIAKHFPALYGQGQQPDEIAEAGLAGLADGPTLYAGEGEARFKALSALPRAQAVEAMVQGMAAYQQAARAT
jgi:short-subunit dehydrogenase